MTKKQTASKRINLIIGGGENTRSHIRASLLNNFNIYLVENNFYIRTFFKNAFPDIKVFKNLDNLLKVKELSQVDLITILLPKNQRGLIYKKLMDFNNIFLVNKVNHDEYKKYFFSKDTFLLLEKAYSFSGQKINKSYFIKNVDSFQPFPKNINETSVSYQTYYSLIIETLLPLHFIFYNKKPKILINKINKSYLLGEYKIDDKTIQFKINFSNSFQDIFLFTKKSVLSFNNFLLDKSLTRFKFILFFYKFISMLTSRWGTRSLNRLYSDLYLYLNKSKLNSNLEKLSLKNCLYLFPENYEK